MQHKRLRALGLGRVRSGMFWSVVLLNILSSYFCSILLAILPIILLSILPTILLSILPYYLTVAILGTILLITEARKS